MSTQTAALKPNQAVETINNLLKACTPYIIVRGVNADELCNTLSQAISRPCYIWDARCGVQRFEEKVEEKTKRQVLVAVPGTPKAIPASLPIDWYAGAAVSATGCTEYWKEEDKQDAPRRKTMLIMRGVDAFWKSDALVLTLPVIRRELAMRAQTIILHDECGDEIPPWLKNHAVVVNWPLPDDETRRVTISACLVQNKLPGEVPDTVVRNSAGIPLPALMQGVLEQIAVEKQVTDKFIVNYKNKLVAGRSYIEPMEHVDSKMVGGHDLLIRYLDSRKAAYADPSKPNPGNMILFGPAGTGKSLLAKMAGHINGLPTYMVKLARLLDKFQGEGVRKAEELFQLMDALSPALFFFDEIEKALGGLKSSNETSGGTLNQIWGMMATYMQESKKRNMYMFTCNGVKELPPEFMRRAGAIFWVGFPEADERRAILDIQNRKHGTNIDLSLADHLEHFTGAEIERVVIDSVFEPTIEDAINGVRPIYFLDPAKYRQMEDEAVNFCRPSSSKSRLPFASKTPLFSIKGGLARQDDEMDDVVTRTA